jgi:transcriptional regulator with XRE-family HTH domain
MDVERRKKASPLKELRQKFGLTQLDFANLAGVEQSHVSKVECGHADLGGKLRKFLKDAGMDLGAFEKRQKAFMEEKRNKLREGFKAKIAVP